MVETWEFFSFVESSGSSKYGYSIYKWETNNNQTHENLVLSVDETLFPLNQLWFILMQINPNLCQMVTSNGRIC